MANEEPQEKKSLNLEQIRSQTAKHRKIILQDFEYDLNDYQEYLAHSKMIKYLGDNYLAREFREFIADRHNVDIIRFLIYYFNGCRKAEEVFPDQNYRIHKNILLIGPAGTGKTLIMQIFADYLKLAKNPSQFINTSLTEMMNYYKIHGHIDRLTYNETSAMEGKPFNICLNDIGLETANQKSYGTSLDTVLDEFLYARYEIYQFHGKKYHLTSNLNVEEFEKRFGARLIDRFKGFNVLSLLGKSRRM